jgi:vacuolar-type H+-ATPase subunit F/Vma7
MRRVLFIGDEATAAGFRLAGAETACPAPDGTAEALAEARARDDLGLILLGSMHAQALGCAAIAEAARAMDPPLTVVRDAAGAVRRPDLARPVRDTLGLG